MKLSVSLFHSATILLYIMAKHDMLTGGCGQSCHLKQNLWWPSLFYMSSNKLTHSLRHIGMTQSFQNYQEHWGVTHFSSQSFSTCGTSICNSLSTVCKGSLCFHECTYSSHNYDSYIHAYVVGVTLPNAHVHNDACNSSVVSTFQWRWKLFHYGVPDNLQLHVLFRYHINRTSAPVHVLSIHVHVCGDYYL